MGWLVEPDVEDKLGAGVVGAIAGGDIAVHEANELAADGKAEACAAEAAGDRGVGLGEGLEEVGDLVFGEADAGVADGAAEGTAGVLSILKFNLDLNGAGGREFEGVAEEVEEDLLDATVVAEEEVWDVGGDMDLELDVVELGLAAEEFFDFYEGLAEGEGGEGEFDFAVFDFAVVEDVVDEFEEGLAGAADGADVGAEFGGEVGLSEEGGDADDGGERGAELVAHDGEEGAFGFAGGAGFIGGGAEVLLELFELGDVEESCDDADDVAVFVMDGGFGEDGGDGFAGFVADPAFFADEGDFAGEELDVFLAGEAGDFFAVALGDAEGEEFFAGVAGEGAGGGVAVEEVAVAVFVVNSDGEGVG